ncbi:uncharacterized protein LY79DRAFT_27052 [Colletotrichum navitas]|uniref:Uncharacterized protein n=1 Tax=Colletotrichum navitas TaxID=681940 RepID=A0AAD8QG04_9PEZI|nr:uncharacterized protein LY79DRAFT_27052 [Colletotrichum navitas]KAK1600658.1 hypothetical protein LY79DRAFT_27052 [Colletotrichum navitas]
MEARVGCRCVALPLVLVCWQWTRKSSFRRQRADAIIVLDCRLCATNLPGMFRPTHLGLPSHRPLNIRDERRTFWIRRSSSTTYQSKHIRTHPAPSCSSVAHFPRDRHRASLPGQAS